MAAGLLLAMTFAAYWPVKNAGIIWDDDEYIIDNPTLLDPSGIWRIWFDLRSSHEYYPLVYTTFWLEYSLTETDLNLPVSHSLNVVLHALCAVVLWRVLKRLGTGGAWFAAAVFAVHPVAVESVAWLVERKNTLSLLMALLSLLMFLRFEDAVEGDVVPAAAAEGDPLPARGDRRSFHPVPYLAALGLFALALTAKTAVAMLPVVVLLLAWWRRGRFRRADVVRMVPFFIVAVALGLITVLVESRFNIGSGTPRPEGPWSRLVAAGWCIWFYLAKSVWPVGLSMIYTRWNVSPATAVSWVPLAGLLALFLITWSRRSAWARPVVAALLTFVVLILPVLGTVDIAYFQHSIVADHFQYFALISPVCLGAAAAAGFVGRLAPSPARRILTVGGAVAVLVVLSCLTWHRGALYVNSTDLWFDAVRKNPLSWAAHFNLGNDLLDDGRFAEAAAHYRQSLSIHYLNSRGHNNLAALLAKQGKNEEAIMHMREAVRLRPADAGLRTSLGRLLARGAKLEAAIKNFRKAIGIDPDHVQAHFLLGAALMKVGRPDEAVDELRRALELNPDFDRARRYLETAQKKVARKRKDAS